MSWASSGDAAVVRNRPFERRVAGARDIFSSHGCPPGRPSSHRRCLSDVLLSHMEHGYLTFHEEGSAALDLHSSSGDSGEARSARSAARTRPQSPTEAEGKYNRDAQHDPSTDGTCLGVYNALLLCHCDGMTTNARGMEVVLPQVEGEEEEGGGSVVSIAGSGEESLQHAHGSSQGADAVDYCLSDDVAVAALELSILRRLVLPAWTFHLAVLIKSFLVAFAASPFILRTALSAFWVHSVYCRLVDLYMMLFLVHLVEVTMRTTASVDEVYGAEEASGAPFSYLWTPRSRGPDSSTSTLRIYGAGDASSQRNPINDRAEPAAVPGPAIPRDPPPPSLPRHTPLGQPEQDAFFQTNSGGGDSGVRHEVVDERRPGASPRPRDHSPIGPHELMATDIWMQGRPPGPPETDIKQEWVGCRGERIGESTQSLVALAGVGTAAPPSSGKPSSGGEDTLQHDESYMGMDEHWMDAYGEGNEYYSSSDGISVGDDVALNELIRRRCRSLIKTDMHSLSDLSYSNCSCSTGSSPVK